MKPLVRVPREASTAMIQRARLLAKPCEFFSEFFNGRTPTLEEKLFWIEHAIAKMTSLQIFENEIYSVQVRDNHPFIQLTIERRDLQPCRDWKHLQQIKNELIGPEHEAVELFPAESRLIDAGNQYHMWVHSDPTYRFSVGWKSPRCVLNEPMTAPKAEPAATPAGGGRTCLIDQAA